MRTQLPTFFKRHLHCTSQESSNCQCTAKAGLRVACDSLWYRQLPCDECLSEAEAVEASAVGGATEAGFAAAGLVVVGAEKAEGGRIMDHRLRLWKLALSSTLARGRLYAN